MPDIYEQHQAAFARVSAYVILHKGQQVAKVAFKYPADGAGRLYAYVHWLGLEMQRGHASGGGYDKNTAACASAAAKMIPPDDSAPNKAFQHAAFKRFKTAMMLDSGPRWISALKDTGFTVLHAV